MKKDRLVAFTDAILAIIMTILVLDLDKPSTPTIAGFMALRTSFFSYALSFFWLGSLWIALNSIWEKVDRIDSKVVWWNLLLLFLASLIPYATSLCSTYFHNRLIQAFYGFVVITMTICNSLLHKAVERANQDNPQLVARTHEYRKMLVPDIMIKCLSLVLCLTVYPPVMMYGVLISAAYVISRKHIYEIHSLK